MEFLGIFLGIIGNILSVIVLIVPMLTFWRIFKKGSTESFSALPYICTLLSNMLWLYYGILDPAGLLLITIGSAGCAFELFYLSVYLVFASKVERISLVKHLSIIVLIFSFVVIFTMKFASGTLRLNVVGILCAFNSICMYASPLSIMRLVITTKSVEYMPFLLSLSLFLCGGVWLGYAIVVRDLYVGVPNGTGFVLGMVQLGLYAFYSKYKNGRDEGRMKVWRWPKTGDGSRKQGDNMSNTRSGEGLSQP